MTEALTSNYWISPNAVRITLNAMGRKDYIQCGAAGGAVIMCYMRDVDGLGYDAGHNYRRWPIVTAPVYFNSWTRKYVYIAIPRSTAVGTSAILVFPSERIDLYGMTEPAEGETEGKQIGSKDYYYIFLRGVISPSRSDGGADQLREWEEYVDYGTLSTDQQVSEGDSEWWRYNADDDTVTFLKVITNATFKVLNVLKNLTVGGDGSFGGSLSVAKDAVVGGLLTAVSAVINSIKSTNYSGSGMADTGWSITNDNGSGSSEAVFDYLTVRKKMTINSLEIKETTFSAGDIAQSCASAEIVRTDYYKVDEHGGRTLLGYSNIRSPWWLRGAVLLLGKNRTLGNYGIFSRYKKVRISLTTDELKECNRIRCYFLAKDGDRNIENWWRVNDLARCQTWNITGQTRQTYEPDWDTKTVGNVYWWRKIHDVSWNTGEPRYVMKDAAGNPVPAGNNYENTTTDQNDPDVYANEADIKRLATNGTYSNSVDAAHAPVEIGGKTYHWFEVDYGYTAEQAGATGWCDAKSDLPAAGDKVVQFGNTTDPDRMNVTISEINGSGNPDAPAIKMFRGIYTFDISLSWWGNVHQPPIKISPATGIHLFAPSFEWGTEYGTAKQIIERPEGYWSEIALEYDDDTRLHPVPVNPDEEEEDDYYPDYSDDIREDGWFISRGGFIIVNGERVYGSAANPIPKNYVRKCRYYERVSHNGSSWLCVIAERKYWRVKQGYSIEAADGTIYNSFDRLPTDVAVLEANKDKTEYVRSYASDEPTPESNNWMEQVQKGGFKSRVFCRTNIRPQTPSSATPAGTEYNTYDNPVPPPTEIKDEHGTVIRKEVWTDGIPQGDEILWSCTCWFYAPGKHSNWTTPAAETDNEKFDVEFSSDYNQPNAPYSGSSFTPDKRGDGTAYGTSADKNKRANGSGEEANWYDPEADKDNTHAEWDKMIWRAERRIANGEYSGTWAISRIKGEAGATPVTAYRWYKDDLLNDPDNPVTPTAPTGGEEPAASDYTGNKARPADKWSKNAPNRPADGWTLFMTQNQIFDDGTYGAWTTPVQISGSTGSPGEDASDQEWIYKFDQNGYNGDTGQVNPTGAASGSDTNKQQNGWVPNGWYDHAQGVDKNHTILYASFRRKSAGRNQAWGTFSDPIIWSHWGRNGMDGDGVEYVFMRTKNNVAPTFGVNDGGNATDYKQEEWLPYINNKGAGAGQANAESDLCTDDPKGTTREWPYEWVAKRTMGTPNADTGAREWKSYYECSTEGSGASETHKMSLWGNHAENVMRLDVSNEMDMIPTDSAGNISANRTVETVVRLFDGATEVTLGEVTVSGGPATSGEDKTANYSQTQSDKGRRLAWQFLMGKIMADSYEINISYTYLNVPYTAVFTVAASKGQPIFQLKPSMSSIPFARNAETNLLTPSDREVGIEIEKIDGINSNTYSSTSGTGVIVRYRFDRMPTDTATSDEQMAWTSGTVTVANTRDNLFIAMFNAAGTLLDRESVPVIRDGVHGDGIVSVTRMWAISGFSAAGSGRQYPADIDRSVPAGTDPWSTESPAVTAEKPYLWTKETTDYKFQDDVIKYYYIGRRGDNGIDAKDAEWVYIRTKTNIAPVISDDENYTDSHDPGRDYTQDDHLPKVIPGTGGSANDIESNNSGDVSKPYECTDDPKGVDDTWKYEWQIKRTKGDKKSDNSRDWLPYSGIMTLFNNLSESTLVIDLTNDNDQFGTDSDGVVNNTQNRETDVTMFYGTEKQAFTSAPTATLKYDDGTPVNDVTVAVANVTRLTSDDKEYRVSVQISATPPGTANPPFKTHNGLYVDITGTCAKGTKTIRFSLERLKSGEKGKDAVIYQLEPSCRTFAFGRDASNNLTPKSNSVNVRLKINQNIYDNPSSIPSGLTVPTLSWGFENETVPAEGHSGLPVGSTITVSPSDVVTASGMHTNVWLLLSTGDREEIPVIVDGANGQNAIRLALDNEHEDFIYDASGKVAPSSVTSAIHLYDGPTEVSGNSYGLRVYDDYANDWVFSTGANASAAAAVAEMTLTVTAIRQNSVKVRVRAEYPLGSGKYYYADFTSDKTADDKYDIIVNPSSIAYNSATFPERISVALSAKGTNRQGEPISNVQITTSASGDGLRVHYNMVKNDGTMEWSDISNRFLTSLPDTLYKSSVAAYAGIHYELWYWKNGSHRLCDYETVEFAKAENAPNLGENLIDGTGTALVVESIEGSGSNAGTRWFGTHLTLSDRFSSVPDNTPLSCQMRIKFENCTNLIRRQVSLWISNAHAGQDLPSGVDGYPMLVTAWPTENGLYEIKHENFTINSGGYGWNIGLMFGWGRYYNEEITDINLGKITVDSVKLEVGERCTAWSLSENDKKGADGTSPWYADLDNEMDSVACDASGVVLGTPIVQTTVSLWHGNTKENCTIQVLDEEGREYESGSDYGQFQIDWDDATGVISIAYNGGYPPVPEKQVFHIILTNAANGITRDLYLTVNGVRSGADGQPATVYSLLPSMNVVTKDENGNPTANVMTFKILKRVGSTETEITTIQQFSTEGLSLFFKKGNNSEAEVTTSYMSEYGNTLVNHHNIETLYNGYSGVIDWVLRKNGALLDREGIGSVQDGADGANGHDGADGHDGNDGQDGKDGWTVTANINPVIINEDINTPDTFNLPMVIQFSAKTGSGETGTVGRISASQSPNMGLTLNTPADNILRIEAYSKVGDVNIINGVINCSVPVTSIDGTTVNYSVSIPVAVNLLGKWSTDTRDGIMIETSKKLGWMFGDPNGEEPQQGNPFYASGHFIRGWQENTSRLSKSVGTNLLQGLANGEGWVCEHNDLTYNAANFCFSHTRAGYIHSGMVFLSPGWYALSVYVPSANNSHYAAIAYGQSIDTDPFDPDDSDDGLSMYVLSNEPTIEYGGYTWKRIYTNIQIPSNTYPNGIYCSFGIATAFVYAFLRPQLERVDSSDSLPTNFVGTSAVQNQSLFKQTAESIELKVGKCGIDIDNERVNVKGGKFTMTDSNGNTTFTLDTDGNLISSGNATFTGKIAATGGSITGVLTVGSSNNVRKIKIDPNDGWGATIKGEVSGTQYFKIGIDQNSLTGAYTPKIILNNAVASEKTTITPSSVGQKFTSTKTFTLLQGAQSWGAGFQVLDGDSVTEFSHSKLNIGILADDSALLEAVDPNGASMWPLMQDQIGMDGFAEKGRVVAVTSFHKDNSGPQTKWAYLMVKIQS